MRVKDRRKPTKYTERLTTQLVVLVGLGCAWVLLDPVIIYPMGDAMVKLGANGFSNDLKGAVIGAVIVGTIGYICKFWLDRNDDRVNEPDPLPEIAPEPPKEIQ